MIMMIMVIMVIMMIMVMMMMIVMMMMMIMMMMSKTEAGRFKPKRRLVQLSFLTIQLNCDDVIQGSLFYVIS